MPRVLGIRAPKRSSPHITLFAVVEGGEPVGSWEHVGRRRAATTPTCDRSGSSPSCNGRLGFLSNFAVAFSYISVSTGTFTNQAVAFGVGGPAVFWAWPIVILGQTFVALNFAELSSHFPVAGSIYQWSKRLSQQDARLVHRLDLLLGRRHHRDRGRGDRAARALDDLSGLRARRAVAGPGLDMQSFIGLSPR